VIANYHPERCVMSNHESCPVIGIGNPAHVNIVGICKVVVLNEEELRRTKVARSRPRSVTAADVVPVISEYYKRTPAIRGERVVVGNADHSVHV